MKDDPIVGEVHRFREQMWNECGGSLDGLIESLRASESAHPERVLSKSDVDHLYGLPGSGEGPASRLR